ncbi:MAG: phytanoyl-CoA dioxygenase family protein [Acidimicrobiales bacterium]
MSPSAASNIAPTTSDALPTASNVVPTAWLRADACRLDEFIEIVERPTEATDFPHAAAVVDRVAVYHSDELRSAIAAESDRDRDNTPRDGNDTVVDSIRRELAEALLNGPGIIVLKGAVSSEAIDRVNDEFYGIIEDEKASGLASGDHFAKPGANDRVWNALEKLALRNPGAFIDYYSNDMIALACEAWLGPDYQVTSQVNVVNPGGQAQQPHRDYHLGFMTNEQAERFPSHIHRLSPLLTLQGAVAHCDMPVETGPTLYLPNSQKYEPGYLAWRLPEFIDYFAEHRVQLPLEKGDLVFFNPALFHAAGTNQTTDIRRIANLLQISSAMGRAMEKINRRAMSTALHPLLLERLDAGVPASDLHRAIAAAAEGYPFPASLDVDQPTSGLAPDSQADLARRALDERWPVAQLTEALASQARSRAE